MSHVHQRKRNLTLINLDPFKDTSGPSMNILIKLTCLIGLVIAPILGGHTEEGMVINEEMSIEKEMVVKEDITEASIAYVVIVDGEEVSKEESFIGTEEEVEAQLKAFEAVNKLASDEDVKLIKKMKINKG